MTAQQEIQPLQRGAYRSASICATGSAEGWGRWKTYCQVLAELRAKPTGELNQMGLIRADLPRVARETAYGYCA